MRTLSILTFLLVAVLLPGPGYPDGRLDGARHPDHDRAVALGRDGAFEESLALLSELRIEFPDDPVLLYDETAILAWAGEDARAVANAGSIDPQTAPDYVLDAVAKLLSDAVLDESERRLDANRIEVVLPSGAVHGIDRDTLLALPGGIADVSARFPKRKGAATLAAAPLSGSLGSRSPNMSTIDLVSVKSRMYSGMV